MKAIYQIINTVKTESPSIYWIVVFHFIAAIGCLIGIALDDTIVTGVNAWTKPFKFSLSGGIYVFTVGYLITFYPYTKRKTSIINNTVAWTILVEIIIIIFQAFRGVQSHYNMSNPFDGILFAIMGVFIGINVIIMALFIFDTLRLKLKVNSSMQLAILLGWLVVFFGSWIGGQMISQMSHNVGVADGGEGLPILNWSTIGGDLRIAHFFGLHGIQIIPLFALWAQNQWKSINRNQILAVTIFGLLYAGLIGFTFYQAKQGMPLISL